MKVSVDAMTPYSALLSEPNGLQSLVRVAEADDLHVVTDYITDSGEGRLSLDSDICKRLVQRRKVGDYADEDRDLIAKEVLLFGGNSVANLYRGLVKGSTLGQILGSVLPAVDQTPEYAAVVKDVAKQVGASAGDVSDVQAMEADILLRIFKKALDKMTEAEKKKVLDELGIVSIAQLSKPFIAGTTAFMATRAAATASLSVASVVASTISSQMLGRSLMAVPAYLGVRPMAALAGPVGLAVGALWTLAGLSSPAYRVTVPCVVQLAYMRQKYLFEASIVKCGNCSETNSRASKFCSSCGHVI